VDRLTDNRPAGVASVGVATWLGRFGKTACAIGVLILLFVSYQLWGTGIRTARAQNDLEQQFRQLQAEHPPFNPRPPVETSSTTSTASATGTSVPPATLPSERAPDQAGSEGARPSAQQPVGRIEIPKIGTSLVVVEGVDADTLKLGPGHFPQTPLPGQPGNAAVAGHRVTFGGPFNRIDELVPGDPIIVETTQGRFTYLVHDYAGNGTGHHIVVPTQTEILNQHGDDNTLTLMACHPKHDLVQRIVVVAKLVESPAPKAPVPTTTTPVDPATGRAVPPSVGAAPLLASDSSWLPTVIWGLVTADIWLAAWLVARRWRRDHRGRAWAIYGAALPLFVAALFFTFEGINALLPAGY